MTPCFSRFGPDDFLKYFLKIFKIFETCSYKKKKVWTFFWCWKKWKFSKFLEGVPKKKKKRSGPFSMLKKNGNQNCQNFEDILYTILLVFSKIDLNWCVEQVRVWIKNDTLTKTQLHCSKPAGGEKILWGRHRKEKNWTKHNYTVRRPPHAKKL